MPQLNVLTQRKTHTQIEELIIDVTLNESYTFKNNITSYPVEDGFFITDHIQQVANTFQINGFCSNSPLYGVLSTTRNNRGRDVIVFDKFLEYGGFRFTRVSGEQPVKIADPIALDLITPLRIYTSMYLESFSVSRSKTNSGGLFFNAGFKQITTVQNEYTQINTVVDVKGATKMKEKITNKNKVGKKNAKAAGGRQSILDKGVNTVSDFLFGG